MPRRPGPLLVFALAALTVACFDSKEDEDDDGDDSSSAAVDRYVTALCRLYSAPECTSAMEDECGFSFGFDSQGECEALFSAAATECPEAVQVIEGMADQVEACAAAIDAIECGVDPLCTEEGESFMSIPACADLAAATDGLCEDTGGWDTGR